MIFIKKFVYLILLLKIKLQYITNLFVIHFFWLIKYILEKLLLIFIYIIAYKFFK